MNTYSSVFEKWVFLRDCFDLLLKEKHDIYLPMPPGMKASNNNEEYMRYVSGAEERGFLKSLVTRATALSIKAPIECKMPTAIDYLQESVNESESFCEFIAENLKEQNIVSRCTVVAEVVDNDIMLRRYKAEQVIFHKYERVNRVKKLTILVLDVTEYSPYNDIYDTEYLVYTLHNNVVYATPHVSSYSPFPAEDYRQLTEDSYKVEWLGETIDTIPAVNFNSFSKGFDFESPAYLNVANMDLHVTKDTARFSLFKDRSLPIINIAGGVSNSFSPPDRALSSPLNLDNQGLLDSLTNTALTISEAEVYNEDAGDGYIIRTAENGNVRSITPDAGIGSMFQTSINNVDSKASDLILSLGDSKVNKDASGTTTSIVLDVKTLEIFLMQIYQFSALKDLFAILKKWGNLSGDFEIRPPSSYFGQTLNPAVFQSMLELLDRGMLKVGSLSEILTETFNIKIELKEGVKQDEDKDNSSGGGAGS